MTPHVRLALLVVVALSCGTALATAKPPPPTAAGKPPPTAKGPAAGKGCRDKNLIPGKANAKRIRAATICLVNTRRRSHGLPPLKANNDLRRAAQSYSRQMVQHRFFAHIGPDGSTLNSRVERTRYLDRAQSWALGENLAWGEDANASPLVTVRKWMASGYHRSQVLAPHFRDIGVGITRGAPMPIDRPGATYSAVFGGRS